MKKTNIFFWTFTGLFGAFMAFTAIPDIMMVPDAMAFMSHLGYPDYLVPFIGVAKVLGVIAIMVPGYPGITEWAYAGLAFDLIGATYSQAATDGLQPGMLFMVLPMTLFVLSYLYHHKRLRISSSEELVVETVSGN